MQFLHPAFTIVALVLMAFSFLEVYSNEYKNYKAVWWVIAVLILLSGFRYFAGADYTSYMMMYEYFGQNLDYDEVYRKIFFQHSDLDIEWLFLVLGNWFYNFGALFFYFTFFISLIALVPKYIVFENSVVYPALSMLLYMFPTYFIADSGQMRQGVALGLILFSFIYIKKRNLFMFLLVIYIAMGFHKSSVIFIPAYWLVKVHLDSRKILTLILICIALSPFQIYEYITILESLAPQDIYAGFSDYSTIENNRGGLQLMDFICLLYAFFVVAFDKEGCENIPYYEYMRNIGVVGICIYFIFRGSPIFSSRLTMTYVIYMVMVIPNILAAIQNINLRRYLHVVVIAFVVFYYFVFASMQASTAAFTPSKYRNYLFLISNE